MLRDLAFGFDSPTDRDIFTDSAVMPSSHQDTPGLFDDVFGSEPSSPSFPVQDNDSIPVSAEHSDIPRLRSIHVTNGYREGIAASKEQHIQAGFDEGYSLGAEIGLRAGWCTGALLGLQKCLVDDAKHGADIAGMLAQCTEQLSLKNVFSPSYFGPDGIWLFDVSGQDASEDDITFDLVAASHPLIRDWTIKVEQAATQLGLAFGPSSAIERAE